MALQAAERNQHEGENETNEGERVTCDVLNLRSAT